MYTNMLHTAESATSNPFLAGDGLLNLTKLAQLRSKIQKELKSAKLHTVKGVFNVPGLTVTNARKIVNDLPEGVELVQKPAKSKTGVTFQVKGSARELKKINQQLLDVAEPKPMHVYSISAKAKTAKYSAAQDKKNNLLYKGRRAIRITQRRSVTSTATLMLPVFGKGLLSKSTEVLIRKAESAVKSHMKKADRVRERVAADKAKVSQERTTAFENAVPALTEMLTGSLGVRENNIVVSSGMGGRSMLAKLPDGTIVRLALADDKQFRDARKAAREAAND